MALGDALLVIAYHLLVRGVLYTDLGGNYFDKQERRTLKRRLVHRLEALGYAVHLQPAVG